MQIWEPRLQQHLSRGRREPRVTPGHRLHLHSRLGAGGGKPWSVLCPM